MNRILRAALLWARRIPLALEVPFDGYYRNREVSSPMLVGHAEWQKYLLCHFNIAGYKILEIGSREVTGKSSMRQGFDKAEYIGFDFYPGPNVDVTGDAHRLSEYFNGSELFDLIFSSATFEHLAMPWVVATEISKMLKVGGCVFVETHFSYGAHERPWNFFQFSDLALRVLFSPALGFETIDAGMSNPVVGRFARTASSYLRNRPVFGLYAHSEFLGRKVKASEDFAWEATETTDLVNATVYPAPKS
jgi:hypothetical protein